jgi:hypothetical protein
MTNYVRKITLDAFDVPDHRRSADPVVGSNVFAEEIFFLIKPRRWCGGRALEDQGL